MKLLILAVSIALTGCAAPKYTWWGAYCHAPAPKDGYVDLCNDKVFTGVKWINR